MTVSQATWTLTTGLLVGFAFLISNLVPFFSAVTAFASALCATLACWCVPCLCALKLERDFAVSLGCGEKTAMKILIPITIVVSLVGTAASVMEMINKLKQDSGTPFGCD